MEIMPKISIITISFNSSKTIERTIKSIIGQNYKNLEYIIVDGGSTDGTIDIIRKYDSEISKWVSEPDKGISDAFNKGIQSAAGDIIGIINSDDLLAENALSCLAQNYDTVTDAYVGNLIYRNEEKGLQYTVKGGIDFDYMSDGAGITHPSTFIARKAYEKYGMYDLNCKTAMDYDLLLRMKKGGAQFKRIEQPLAVFTMAGITYSDYTKAKLDEHIYIIKKNGAKPSDVLLYIAKRKIKNLTIKVIGRNNITRIRSLIHKSNNNQGFQQP